MNHRLLYLAAVVTISLGLTGPIGPPPCDDDKDPCDPVSIDDFIMWESIGTASVPVWSRVPCDHARTITYSTYDLTARAGEDYVGVSSGTFVFPAGQTRATVTIQVVRDNVTEPVEHFGVRLTAGARFDDPDAVVTINDR
jgi:hypothetical protein